MSRSMQRNPFNLFSKFMNANNSDSAADSAPRTKNKKSSKKKMLDTYGINLTAKAQNGEIDAVIGRNSEIERTMQILNRRTKKQSLFDCASPALAKPPLPRV